MEEDQELKHVCKFCNKSFPCGRSLGGHMRSHVLNSADDQEKPNNNKKKVSSFNNGGGGINASSEMGYGLRENPKKTCRFADSNEDTLLLHEKLCKECGKGFQSWKALFGHMKCHSEKFANSLEAADSWASANQSDTETAAVLAPNRKKRSRRVTRYLATTTTTTTTTNSSFSIANNNNNASSSVSEIEQEQEEVAMCLMMLSRDKGSGGNLNSVDESSDNNFELLESKNSRTNDEAVKFKKLRNGKLEHSASVLDSNSLLFGSKQSEHGASVFSRNGILGNDKTKKSRVEDGSGFEASDVELGKNLINGSGLDQAKFSSKKHNNLKKNKCPELGVDYSKKLSSGDTEMVKGCEKKSKFECTTCNKTFHSYQALGGHRASHKKNNKSCFASIIDSSETSIETEISPSPDPTADSKLTKSPSNEQPIEQEFVVGCDEKAEPSHAVSKNVGKGHECPICFKVFSSGQALGGHKRSHLISSGSEAKTNQTIVIQKPTSEIRDLLDLNLPAPAEEESSGHVGFKPWWIESNHKHEPIVGLLYN